MPKKITILIQGFLFCALAAASCSAQEQTENSTRLEITTAQPILVYQIKNTTGKPVKVVPIGLGNAIIRTRMPSGKIGGSSTIVEWTKPPPLLAAGEKFAEREDFSKSLGYAVGLYSKWLQVEGVDTEKVALYRELDAPFIDSRFGEDIDSIRVVTDLFKQGDFAMAQKQRRQEQLDASEGMKQYVMEHPYILALSVDGKPGFRLKLMATNNTQKSLELPELNTLKNRIEIVGFNKNNVWSYPRHPLQEDADRKLELKVGETHSWTEDIGRYIKEKGIRLAGRYTARWIIDEKDVANFVFYLPEEKEKNKAN